MKKHVHVVAAVIQDEQGRIFCAQRSAQMTLPHKWEFPGGKIEAGERNEAALQREIMEELDCQIEVQAQIDDTFYAYESFTIQLETYWAKITQGSPILEEHASSLWLPYDQLEALDWAEADIPTVRKVVAQCKKEFMNKSSTRKSASN